MTENESSNIDDIDDDLDTDDDTDDLEDLEDEKPAETKPRAPASRHIDDSQLSDSPRVSALEVSVDQNIEKAMKILKRKLIKEGLFKELKLRRYYEKPSERKKRKLKESLKKLRKEESRMRKNSFI